MYTVHVSSVLSLTFLSKFAYTILNFARLTWLVHLVLLGFRGYRCDHGNHPLQKKQHGLANNFKTGK